MKSILFLASLFLAGQPMTTSRSILTKDHAKVDISHQAVLLKSVEMTYATPSWADGKNDDGSNVDGEVDIYSTDGNVYKGFGKFRDGSGITKNGLRVMTIEMAGGINMLDKSTITQIVFTTTFGFDQTVGRGHSDHWTFRDEAVLTFADGSVIATGYNEPPHDMDFEDIKQTVTDKSTIFHDSRTLKYVNGKIG